MGTRPVPRGQLPAGQSPALFWVGCMRAAVSQSDPSLARPLQQPPQTFKGLRKANLGYPQGRGWQRTWSPDSGAIVRGTQERWPPSFSAQVVRVPSRNSQGRRLLLPLLAPRAPPTRGRQTAPPPCIPQSSPKPWPSALVWGAKSISLSPSVRPSVCPWRSHVGDPPRVPGRTFLAFLRSGQGPGGDRGSTYRGEGREAQGGGLGGLSRRGGSEWVVSTKRVPKPRVILERVTAGPGPKRLERVGGRGGVCAAQRAYGCAFTWRVREQERHGYGAPGTPG